MSVYSVVSEYFDNVINYTDFVIAVDEAGVFVFTTNEDDRTVLVKLSKLLNGLSLHKDQVIVCVIDENTDNVYSSFDCVERDGDTHYVHRVSTAYFEDFVRKYASGGKRKLTDQEVDEIVECFYDVVEKNERNAVLREELKKYELSDDAIKRLVTDPNLTKELVYSVGTKHEYADEVYSLVFESRNSTDKLLGDADGMTMLANVVSDTALGFVSCKCLLLCSVFNLAAFAASSFGYWWIGLLFCIGALRVTLPMHKRYDSFVIKGTLVFTTAMTLFVALEPCYVLLQKIASFAVSKGFDLQELQLFRE